MATKAEKKAIKDQAQMILKIGDKDYEEELHRFHLGIIDKNQEIVMKSLLNEAERVAQTKQPALPKVNEPVQSNRENEGGNRNNEANQK